MIQMANVTVDSVAHTVDDMTTWVNYGFLSCHLAVLTKTACLPYSIHLSVAKLVDSAQLKPWLKPA